MIFSHSSRNMLARHGRAELRIDPPMIAIIDHPDPAIRAERVAEALRRPHPHGQIVVIEVVPPTPKEKAR